MVSSSKHRTKLRGNALFKLGEFVRELGDLELLLSNNLFMFFLCKDATLVYLLDDKDTTLVYLLDNATLVYLLDNKDTTLMYSLDNSKPGCGSFSAATTALPTPRKVWTRRSEPNGAFPPNLRPNSLRLGMKTPSEGFPVF